MIDRQTMSSPKGLINCRLIDIKSGYSICFSRILTEISVSESEE